MRVTSLPPYLYKSSMPNLCQTDRRSETLQKNGLTLCGPVTASNILIYLARRYFPFIVESMGKLSGVEAQLKLIDKLSDVRYMNSDRDGTDDYDLIEGFSKYVREQGYRTKTFIESFNGEKDFTPKVLTDQLKIMPFAIGTSNAILSVSFCQFDPETMRYDPIDEWHYINLAGFINSEDPKLIIHDPSPATERELKKCELFEIEQGVFDSWYPPKKFDANGFCELEGIGIDEDDREKGANKIVLDGILAFDVFRK